MAMTHEPKTQLDNFKEAARELECSDDEMNFDKPVKKLAEKPE